MKKMISFAMCIMLSLGNMNTVYGSGLMTQDSIIEEEKEQIDDENCSEFHGSMPADGNELGDVQTEIGTDSAIIVEEDLGSAESDFDYVIDGVQECAKITGYKGLQSDIIIPVTIEGYPVKFVSGFQHNLLVEKVTIPEGVVELDDWAFYGCENLAEIELPNTLITMGYCAFQDCSALEYIILPDGLDKISANAFLGCENLSSVILPSKLKKINQNAFSYCTNMTMINIPETVNTIEEGAFRECINLQKINIPEGVEKINGNTFYGCISLTHIDLPESLTYIYGYSFYNSGLQEVFIPKNVRTISDLAFRESINLTRVIVSGNNTDASSAFSNCEKLSQIICYGNANIRCSNISTEACIYGVVNSNAYNFAVDKEYNFYKINSPLGLKIENVNENSIKLTWNAENHVAGYKVYRSTKEDRGYQQIASVQSDEYTNTGLDNNTNYYYKVCVYYENGDEVEGILTNPVKRDIRLFDEMSISCSKVEKYTGKEVKPAITVEDGGIKLKENIDYSVTYENNINPGTAFVIVKGINPYIGTRTINFEIVNLPQPDLTNVVASTNRKVVVNWKSVENAEGYYVYRRTKDQKWEIVDTIISGKSQYVDSDIKSGYTYYYTVASYKNVADTLCVSTYNEKGKSIKIALDEPKLLSVKTSGYNKLKISWERAEGARGYIVYRSNEKGGKYKKVKTLTGVDTVKYINEKLEGKKRYYYKIRAYYKVVDAIVYSDYSGIKSCVVKGANITLSKKSMSIMSGDNKTLKLSHAYGKVTWKSLNKSIATVYSSGTVYGKKAGSTIIIAKYNGKEYKCAVTIKQDYLPGTFVYTYAGNYTVRFKIVKRYGGYYVNAYGRGGRMNTSMTPIEKVGSRYESNYGDGTVFFSISDIKSNSIRVNFPLISEFNGTYYRQ